MEIAFLTSCVFILSGHPARRSVSSDADDDVASGAGLVCLGVAHSKAHPTRHDIFIRQHRTEQICKEKPGGLTLFVANVPSWATARAISNLFNINGPVDSVLLQRSPTSGDPPLQAKTYLKDAPDIRVGYGFKYAYVVFEQPSSVGKALSMKDNKTRFLNGLSVTGIEKWRQEYNESIVTDVDALMKEVEEGVANLEAAAAKKVNDAEQQLEQEMADGDGWITVSRHTSKKPVGKVSSKVQARIKARENRKRKRKDLENFYKYQVKESKLRKLDELKAKFELDKKKQLEMKKDRKFRPGL